MGRAQQFLSACDFLHLGHKQGSESQFGITPKMHMEEVLVPMCKASGCMATWLRGCKGACCVFGHAHCYGHGALSGAMWLPESLGHWALWGCCSKDMTTLFHSLFILQPMKNVGSPLFPSCGRPPSTGLSHTVIRRTEALSCLLIGCLVGQCLKAINGEDIFVLFYQLVFKKNANQDDGSV